MNQLPTNIIYLDQSRTVGDTVFYGIAFLLIVLAVFYIATEIFYAKGDTQK